MRNIARMWSLCVLTGLTFALTVAYLMLLFSSSATSQGGREVPGARFEFALIGDMPYDARQEKEFANVMRDIDSAELAFVVHDGDFWYDGGAWTEQVGGFPPCGDETFKHRLDLAQSSKHPFIFVAGDNDWADCHRAKPRTYDPLERLAKLRQVFFGGDHSLGQRTIPLTRQSEDSRYANFRENVRWTQGDVIFLTLHVIGSNNNLGRTPEMDAEYLERNAANLAWMREAFDLATRSGSRAIMIVAQADPRFENTWPAYVQQRYMLEGLGLKSPETRRATGFDEFLAALEKETVAFGKPVVYVHGDTHIFRVDKPLFGSTSRRTIENFTRVETIGYPDTHWVRAIVDPKESNVFSFRLEIVEANRVKH
jgi:hypothetical protein